MCDVLQFMAVIHVKYPRLISQISFIFQENAVSVICVPVLDTLACVVYADEMTVLKMPTGLRRSILAIYVIIVHRLHNTELPDSVCDVSILILCVSSCYALTKLMGPDFHWQMW